MKNTSHKHILFCLIFAIAQTLSAQDPFYTQFFISQVHTNPAMAGTQQNNDGDAMSRFNMIYRNQWPQFEPGIQTYNIAYDRTIGKKNHGLGFMFNNDLLRGALLIDHKMDFSAIYNYHLNFNDLQIRLGGQLDYSNRNFELQSANFVFIDGKFVPIYDPSMPYYTSNASNINNKIGASLYDQDFYGGIAINHLNRPYTSFLGSNERLALLYTLHGGGVFKPMQSKIINMYIDGMFLKQRNQNLAIVGGNMLLKKIIVGYHLKTAFNQITNINSFEHTAMLGYKNKSMLITYGYGNFFSSGRDLTTHEIALRYCLLNKKTKENSTGFAQTPWL